MAKSKTTKAQVENPETENLQEEEVQFRKFDWLGEEAANNIKMVDIEEIRTSATYGYTQTREIKGGGHADPEKVEEYAELYKEHGVNAMRNIRLVYNQMRKQYSVVDGYTRIEAAATLDIKKIPAVVLPGDFNDALREAAGQNFDHGQPRKREDKQRAIRLVLENPVMKDLSSNQIAKIVKVSPATVEAWRHKVAPETVNAPRRRGGSQSGTTVSRSKKSSAQSRKAAKETTSESVVESGNVKSIAEPITQDMVGVELPNYLRGVFDLGDKLRAHNEEIRKAKNAMNKLVNEFTKQFESDEWITELYAPLVNAWKESLKEYNGAYKNVELNVLPYAVSPYCKGRNPKPKKKDDICPVTGSEKLGRGKYINRGWLTEQQYKDVPEELTKSEEDAWESGYWERVRIQQELELNEENSEEGEEIIEVIDGEDESPNDSETEEIQESPEESFEEVDDNELEDLPF